MNKIEFGDCRTTMKRWGEMKSKELLESLRKAFAKLQEQLDKRKAQEK